MFEVHLPQLRKYQNLSRNAGIIGFLLGAAVSGIGVLIWGWPCPFGDGLFQTFAFSVFIGVIGAAVFGNLVAFLLMSVVKRRHVVRKASGGEGGVDGD